MASRGSVYRRGATWTAHVSWGSGATKRQVKKGGYRTRKEAQAALTELLGSIDAGTFVTPSRLDAHGATSTIGWRGWRPRGAARPRSTGTGA